MKRITVYRRDIRLFPRFVPNIVIRIFILILLVLWIPFSPIVAVILKDSIFDVWHIGMKELFDLLICKFKEKSK